MLDNSCASEEVKLNKQSSNMMKIDFIKKLKVVLCFLNLQFVFAFKLLYLKANTTTSTKYL